MNATLVQTTLLKDSYFNPSDRVKPKKLESLIKSMEKDGFWEFAPILVTNKYEIIDGHRRKAAALKLHIEQVPIIIVPKEIASNAEEAWTRINSTRMTIKANHILESYVKGNKYLPTGSTRQQILRLQDLGGEPLLKKLVETSISPGVLIFAIKVCRYLNRIGDDVFLLKVIYWMIEFKTQNASRAWIETGGKPATLLSAINKQTILIW